MITASKGDFKKPIENTRVCPFHGDLRVNENKKKEKKQSSRKSSRVIDVNNIAADKLAKSVMKDRTCT